ncbi:MAG: hypothetical protein C0425_02185 [Chlorobiaceae bacterium]|nr:hypothetical protein [Chlorobiaceae bacterium]
MKIFISLFLLTLNIFSQNKSVEAVRTPTPPDIDGHLTEEVWMKAKVFSDFTQQEPNAGQSPSFRTEVRILYDEDYIYLGIMCYDDEPEKIIAREMKWDGRMGADDYICFLFDTFNDDRNAYWFGTNPLGMRDDALLSGIDFSGFNENWNGIWDVQATISDSGWSVELAFPFSTFKFKNLEEQVWGFNIERGIKRKGETVLWTSVGKNLGLYKIQQAGDLIGMKNINRGNPIYLKPFLTGGIQETTDETKRILKTGLDIKYGITERLSLDLTFNTDFAQVESDRARINLSRFPLFFPEKREFFLEGASIFDYAFGGSNRIFYSRRIGLRRGAEIPILGGAKLVGKIDKAEVGILSMQTAKKGDEQTTNYSVARMKYDLFDQSYAGFLVTSKYSKGSFNRVYAGDFEFVFDDFLGDKNLKLGAGFAKSDDSSRADDSWAFKFYADYPNDLIDQFISYRIINANFNPEMGFISRTGLTNFSYVFRLSPRVNWGPIKQLRFEPLMISHNKSQAGEHLAAEYSFSPFGFTTFEGDGFEVELERHFDNVDEDFEIFDGKLISAGNYWFTLYEASFYTSAHRPVHGGMDFGIGNYYTGNIVSVSSYANFRISKHLTLIADHSYNNISLGADKFETNEFGSTIRVDFSTMMNTSLFTQWNNEAKELNFNYRFNWQPKIGSNFYLVINHLFSTENKIQSKDFAVLTKFVWMINI